MKLAAKNASNATKVAAKATKVATKAAKVVWQRQTQKKEDDTVKGHWKEDGPLYSLSRCRKEDGHFQEEEDGLNSGE